MEHDRPVGAVATRSRYPVSRCDALLVAKQNNRVGALPFDLDYALKFHTPSIYGHDGHKSIVSISGFFIDSRSRDRFVDQSNAKTVSF